MYHVKTHIDWAKEESDREFAAAYAKLVAYWRSLEYGCPEKKHAQWETSSDSFREFLKLMDERKKEKQAEVPK